MNDTARDSNQVDQVSTKGLDHIFELSDSTLISEQGRSNRALIVDEGGSDQTLLNTQINPDHWTLNIAAQALQVSVITIRRKLQKGQIKGYKVQGINGPEWRIIPPDQPTITERTDSDQTVIFDRSQSSQQSEQTMISPDHLVIDALLKRLSHVESQLANAQNELQGAVWRNGYLESLAETKDQQIKLLTDSQHKPGWWARFSSWFFKAQ
jgi:hypothetical protein